MQKRPNIVLVHDRRPGALADERPVHAQRLEALGDEGTRFDHAYLTTPLCCPSRAGLETGQYGHNNGVLRNVYELLRDKNNVLPVWLNRAGYVTAHIGKFMNLYRRHKPDPLKPAPGWDQWYTLFWKQESAYYNYDMSKNGKRVHYGQKPKDYSTRVFNGIAKRLIDKYVPRKHPLYLELDETAPHPSVHRHHVSACNPVPDPRDEGRFNNVPLPDPPSFNESDMSDKPSFMRIMPRLTNTQIDRMTRNYDCGLDALAGVDRSVGQIYDKIKQLHELGRTIFIYYTDNGVFKGEHRIFGGKLNPYEEADSTPLMMRVPSQYLKRQAPVGHVTDPVANIDLAPTMLKLAHGKPCPASGPCRVMDGRSILPLIKGKTPDWAPDRPLGHRARPHQGQGAPLRVHLPRRARRQPGAHPVSDRRERPELGQMRARQGVGALRPEQRPLRAQQPVLRGRWLEVPAGPRRGAVDEPRTADRQLHRRGRARPAPAARAPLLRLGRYSQKGRAVGASRPWIPEQRRSWASRAASRAWIPA